MTFEATLASLKAASVFVIGFGILAAMSAYPPLDGLMRIFMDLAFWPIDGAPQLASPETRLLFAIMGGIMAGFGTLLWLIASRLYPREPRLARMMIMTSIGTWFVIDGIASAIAGAPFNAILNISFLLIFVIPLILAGRTQGNSEASL